jgi:hypothetical protein
LACGPSVAQRVARQLRPAIPAFAALVIAATAIATTAPAPASAAYAPRVVIVVGPAGASTGDYLRHARQYASQARSYGASVISILAPHATWPRVLAASQGANVFIYLGHGNGWPSPYAPFQGLTKDGIGLNPYDGAPSSRVKYYGEDMLRAHIRLAPGAIVLLNRLCYAAGNAEPGFPEPSWSTAVKRVDNFAAGFLRTGASAVLADGHTSLAYELRILFGPSRSIVTAWADDPDANGHVRVAGSTRVPGTSLRLDPDGRSTGFYRSLATRSRARTGTIRIPALAGHLSATATLRSGASATTRSLGTVPKGAFVVARGHLTTDRAGRSWVPVMTRTGKAAWVAAWIVTFRGTARARTDVVLRSSASQVAHRRAVVRGGARVTVLSSTHDRRDRTWFSVRTSSGSTGWIAGWLTTP